MPPTAWADNQPFWVKIKNTNTGASTFTPNNGVLAAVPIVGGAHQALQGGELAANGRALMVYRADINSVVLMECSGAAVQVGNATQSQHAVTLGQIAQAIGTTAAQFDNSLKLATTAFVKTSGESFGGLKSVTGAATLDATYAGQLTVLTGTTYACTLPAASSYPAGTVLTFYSAASGAVTLNRASTDVISVNNATSLTSMALNSGDTLTLVSNGSNAWEAQAGSAQLAYAGIFGSLLSGNGYQKLPGGLILQWGTFNLNFSAAPQTLSQLITYPIAFTTGAYDVNITALTATPASFPAPGVTLTSASQFTAYAYGSSNNASQAYYWFALGK
jgi:hypothetical protein